MISIITRVQLLLVTTLHGAVASSQAGVGRRLAGLEPCGDARPRLVLTWIDPEHIISDTAGVFEEVNRVLESVGVTTEWRVYEGSRRPSEVEVELYVYLRMAEPKTWQLGSKALGVVLDPGPNNRRVFVFFPALARTLGYEPKELRSVLGARDSRNFVRALSRVIVHEVFHAVAPTLAHARSGITSERLTRRRLIAREAHIEPQAVEAFRRSLSRLERQSKKTTRGSERRCAP